MAFAGEGGQFNCLFLDEEFSDVEILVETSGSLCRFPCHKLILSKASEVFATMFQSKLTEGENGKVTVTDIKPDVMLILLTYIYSVSVDFDDWKTAIDVLSAAHKYQLKPLIEHCVIYLSDNLTLRNVCFILDIAVLYNLIGLKIKCKELCRYGGHLILKSRTFKHLSASAVRQILRIRSLFVQNEIDVFKALWEWATMECCRKQQKLTEENIFAEFSIFSKFVTFESMTDAELNSLPKTASKYVCDKKRKNSPNGEKVGAEKRKKSPNGAKVGDEKRKKSPNGAKVGDKISAVAETDPNKLFISEGLESYKMTKCFRLETSSTITLQQGHLSLLRFSVNVDAYLVDFVLMPLHDSHDISYFKSFRLFCKDKIVIEWPKKDNETLKLYNNGLRFASVKDDTKVQELVFRVYGFVLLEAGMEYTAEVEPEVCHGDCPLKWPSVSLINTEIYRQDNFELFVHSQSSFGVGEMTFLRSI